MRPRLLLALVLICGGSFSGLQGCSTPEFYAEPRYGWANASGHFGIQNTNGTTGTTSLSTLGDNSSQTSWGGRVDVSFGSPTLTIMGWSTDFEGPGTTTTTLSHNGNTIAQGTPVDTTMDLDSLAAILTFDFFPGESYSLALGFGADVLNADITVDNKSANVSISTSQLFPVPALAASAGVTLFDRLTLSVLALGMYIDYGSEQGSFLDADANVRYRFAGEGAGVGGYITAGWRFTGADIDYEEGNDSASLRIDLSGPYLGLAISF